MDKNIIYYGSQESLPEQKLLRAGPLTLCFEAGDLRYIKLGTHEIIRRIYVAVRDQHWRTIKPEISNLKIESDAASFRIEFDCDHRQDELDFHWHATLSGNSDGMIKFTIDGEARSTFRRNRIGLCLLHPVAVSGAPVRVTHPDHSFTEGTFPRLISPHQPFFEIRSIAA